MAAEDTEAARQSIESGSDDLSTIPAVESPSSSSRAPESPEIEIVAINEDGDDGDSFANRSPPLAIIDENELFIDPYLSFPYNTQNETLVDTVKRLAHFLQYGRSLSFHSQSEVY